MKTTTCSRWIFTLLLILAVPASAQITQIIDATGDGTTALDDPRAVAVDSSGNVFVQSRLTDVVFKVAPSGAITLVLDATGDGTHTCGELSTIGMDTADNLYAICGDNSNLFKITPGGTITTIWDPSAHGASGCAQLAVDGTDNVYAGCFGTDNVFKITPGGTVTEIINATGDGTNPLDMQFAYMGADSAGNFFVGRSAGAIFVFKVTPGGAISTIFDATGDGVNACSTGIYGIGVDPAGNVFVPCTGSNNAFKITPGGTITQIIDATGDGAGNALGFPHHAMADADGNAYVSGFQSQNVFKIEPSGTITEIIDSTGDGAGNGLNQPNRGAAGPGGNFYISSSATDSVFEIGPGDPELSVAALIPGAELETVDVDVDLTTNGNSIAATTFSFDYDETCLSFDDTDGDADNIPDDLAFNLPAGFSVTAFHDLGDSDGEIDVSITDLAPPIGVLLDGAILTVTFTSTCSPAVSTTIVAPVGFSSDPAATFSDDLAVDVDGTTTDGSVEIWPGPRGDCNSTGALSAADLIADALEIFDDDGTFWADVVGSTYVGSPVGCDANDDTVVDAGDISCTILLIFGGDCGTGSRGAFDAVSSPVLGLGRAYEDKDGRLWIPVKFDAGNHGISSIAFSLNLANRGLAFNPFDGDGNGLPDSVRFPGARPDLVDVRYNARDRRGELDLTVATFDGTLGEGVLLEVAVEPKRHNRLSRPARFSRSPAASFGDLFGRAVTGDTVNASRGK